MCMGISFVSAINDLMSQALDTVFPGVQLLVFRGRKVLYEACMGREGTGNNAAITPATAFDLASLTKPLCTAGLIALLMARGLLNLDMEVSQVITITRGTPIGGIGLRSLLNHSSGLAPWQPWGRDLLRKYSIAVAGTNQARTHIFNELFGQTLPSPPVYSDLGFILLGAMVEKILNTTLDQAFHMGIAKKIDTGLFFVPVSRGRPVHFIARPMAATRHTNLRGLIHGTVDDDNAFVLGGVAGHAGLFGSARDVYALLSAWLDSFNGKGFLPQGLVHEFWSYENMAGSFVLGFDTPAPNASSAGTALPKGLVGHLGFTGTSFWLDPKTGLGVILLTNRVNPDPENTLIRQFRPLLHDLIWQTFG